MAVKKVVFRFSNKLSDPRALSGSTSLIYDFEKFGFLNFEIFEGILSTKDILINFCMPKVYYCRK